MHEARKGNGFDRHLFGLWCWAHENKIPIPEFYNDPLYAKSGGGGNFVLSTSTLGYSIFNGCVAPMVLDGYGVFYSMLDDFVFIINTTFSASRMTCAQEFYKSFSSAMNEMKKLVDVANASSKL
jgi:carnitine O-octanoyltransferase